MVGGGDPFSLKFCVKLTLCCKQFVYLTECSEAAACFAAGPGTLQSVYVAPSLIDIDLLL